MDNSTLHNYYPSQPEIKEFARMIEHKCFTGKKKVIKDKWKSLTEQTQVIDALKSMEKDIAEWELKNKEKEIV